MAGTWKNCWDKINIDYDDFIRTTESRHTKTVTKFFQLIEKRGDIYKGNYHGKYCTGCETFLKDSDLNEKGECPDHRRLPEEISEENYFFRLSNYQDKLLELFESNPNFIRPARIRKEIINFVKGGLEDISVSRESAEFGINLPTDNKHKVYVWFEALINYYTAVDNDDRLHFWEHAEHIIGKDIIKFHCVIWPAMLMSAGLSVPKEVFAHGFFTINGEKMSKSLGNAIHPLTLVEEFGSDILRIGLLNSFEFGNDGDFSLENFSNFARTKIAGGIGNLFNRVLVLSHKFLDGQRPNIDIKTTNYLIKFDEKMQEKSIAGAIKIMISAVDEANKIINDTELWKLAKSDKEASYPYFSQIFNLMDQISEMSISLLPKASLQMQKMLGTDGKLGDPVIIFQLKDK